jgi:molecular chaperone DnaJ
VLTLRGLGIENVHGRGRGDQRVIVQVTIPTRLGKRQKELLEEYAREAGESAGGLRGKSLFDMARDAFKRS